MSAKSTGKIATLFVALLATLSFVLSSNAWSAPEVEHQLKETDGHDHVQHKKDHNLDPKKSSAEPKAKSTRAPAGTKGDKSSTMLHETEETDGHDHVQHKKDHNLSR